MEEFWRQGDDETSKGLTTLENIEPILDRRQSVNLPSLEVKDQPNSSTACRITINKNLKEIDYHRSHKG